MHSTVEVPVTRVFGLLGLALLPLLGCSKDDPDSSDTDTDTDTDVDFVPSTTFADSVTTWAVPDEELGGYGFNKAGEAHYDNGSWAVMDLTGDQAPDLVWIADEGSPLQVWGYDTGSAHWKVFENTGSGFASSATTWAVPDEELGGYGFNKVGEAHYDNGSWTAMDLDGDRRGDLVWIADEGSPLQVWGYDSGSAYWKVFLGE